MTSNEALATIRRLAAKGLVSFTGHALQRMDERGVTPADVRAALTSARVASFQAERDSWKVEGNDTDDDDLTVIVSIEADLIVITVF